MGRDDGGVGKVGKVFFSEEKKQKGSVRISVCEAVTGSPALGI
jgi:hypothetical protein